MRRRRGPAVALAVTAVVFTMWFVGSAVPAQACSCAVPPDEATRDAQAETIIVGRVASVTEHEGTDEATGEVEYVVRVEVLHKGEITDPVSLWTAADDGLCGVHLDVDLLYKLYPRRADDGRQRITLCDGNRQATQADLEPLELTPTPDPTATTAGTSGATTSSTGPPGSVTTATTAPFGMSTSTAPVLPTSTSTSARPSDALPAIGIDDDGDGDGTGLLLPALGVVAVASVGVAAFALRRLRDQSPPLAPGLPPMHDVHGGGRRPRR